MKKSNNLINESIYFRYFREFTTNTAFLYFPLIAEIVFDGILKIFSPIHFFLFVGLLFQTYILIKIKNNKFINILLINLFIPLCYLVIEFIVEGNIFNNSIYILYFIYILINGFINATVKLDNFEINKFLKPIDIFIKLLLIPIFYYILDFRIGDTTSSFFVFYFLESNIHSFLLFIFIFLGIIFGIDSYLSIVRKHILDKLLGVLHMYSSWIVDDNELLENISKGEMELSTKKMYKVVVFMDIRGFTNWSENNKPENITNMLNGFYEVAEKSISKYNGKINKYVADEIVFLFDDLDEAINYSLELKEKEIKYLSNYSLNVGFGINAGILVYGWIGSDLKKEQTVIGDVVNIAARLEGGFNQIKIPKSIVPNRYNINNLGKLSLKGKKEDIEIVEILGNIEE